MTTNIEIAAEYQSKFRFYFVALVFTLLAASIQTADLLNMNTFNKWLELFSWFLFLTSGLSSLSYLEHSPVVYRHRDAIDRSEGEIAQEIKEQLLRIESESSFKYAISKYSFAIGLVFVIVSRGIHGLYPVSVT